MLHDLVIKIMVQYLPGENATLRHLQIINKRFYTLRDIFISHMALSEISSAFAYKNKPHGWNLVYSMILNGCHNINDLSGLEHIKVLRLNSCKTVIDATPLKSAHSLILYDMAPPVNMSMMPKLRHLTLLRGVYLPYPFSFDKIKTLTMDRMPGRGNKLEEYKHLSIKIIDANLSQDDMDYIGKFRNLTATDCWWSVGQ